MRGIYSDLCRVPPDPKLRKKLLTEYKKLKKKNKELSPLEFLVYKGYYRQNIPGLDDGTRLDPEKRLPEGVETINVPKFRPRGDVNALFILVDFSDRPISRSVTHFKKLLFSKNNVNYDTKSLNEYYKEVSYDKVNVIGDVIDTIRLPKTYSYYAGLEDGFGQYPMNAKRMVEDAVNAAKQKGGIDWDKYDVNGDGMIDALSIIHAGRGAEQTGHGNGDIWSHKWNITYKLKLTSNTYVSTYLTVPEDSKLGVIAHELGHLLFGWPDLYDSEPNGIRVTEGLGEWCLMAAGSWNNMGKTPGYPCGWCRHVQGWTDTVNVQKQQDLTVKNIEENPEIYRLWTKGQANSEYFMMENRQKVGFDRNLPGDGIIIYQIDEKAPNNWNEDHLAVGVMQADGRRDLSDIGGTFRNQGDASDPYPGTTRNFKFGTNTKPNSRSFANKPTGVFVELLDRTSSKSMKVKVRV